MSLGAYPFVVPNAMTAGVNPAPDSNLQAQYDALDLAIMAAATAGTGVKYDGSGNYGIVAAQSSPNMTVQVAASTDMVLAAEYACAAAASLSIAANTSGNPRFDLVVSDAAYHLRPARRANHVLHSPSRHRGPAMSGVADIFTEPRSMVFLTTMELELGFLAPLGSGVTITSVTTSLYDLNESSAVTLSDEPTFSGATIFQWVRGPTQLVAMHGYRLTVSYTGSDGQTNGGVLLINVPVPTP